MQSDEIITYVDDYCYKCNVMCKQTDPKHKYHPTLSKELAKRGLWQRLKNRLFDLIRQ